MLRIAAYNICWFANLFDDGDRLHDDRERSAMYQVTRHRQGAAIAAVLARVDADAFAIIEAPNDGKRNSTVRALEGFAARFDPRQNRALIGFPSETDQEIALLYDPHRIAAHHDPVGLKLEGDRTPGTLGETAPRFDGDYPLDLDGDGQVDLHRFSKPPLEATITDLVSGLNLRLIAVHAKSKAPYGATDPAEAARISLLNRRKQLAQCAWLRARVDEHLDRGEHVIALGDFNDGPGQDKYERAFGRSGVEVVMGDVARPGRLLRNPFIRAHRPGSTSGPASARFYSRARKGFLNALIDFVMLSPDLAARTTPHWDIWHPFDNQTCFADAELRAALLDASDHFPVTVDLTV